MAKVFVSFSSRDRDLVERAILPYLKDASLDRWYSTDDIRAAEKWQKEIVQALRTCDAMVVAMTHNAEDSPWVTFEVGWALENFADGRVVPVKLSRCSIERIHPLLLNVQHVDLSSESAGQRRKLERALHDIRVAASGQGNAFFDGHDGSVVGPTGRPPLERALLDLGRSDSGADVARGQLSQARIADVRNAMLSIVGRGVPAELERLADTLPGLPASSDLVALLGEVVDRLRGPIRNRVETILDRKRGRVAEAQLRARMASIDGRVTIERALGQGFQTSAFLATETATGKVRVVRVLKNRWASRPAIRERFIAVAEKSRDVHHRRIAATRWAGRHTNHRLYYIVRDHIDGLSLRDMLEQRRSPSFGKAVEFMRQLVETMLHSELHDVMPLHGAIRPSNLFLLAGDRLLLGDFASLLPAESLEDGVRGYDLRYAAPESFDESWSAPDVSSSRAGFSYDVYSVGAVAHELIFGSPHVAGDRMLDTLKNVGRSWKMPSSAPPPAATRAARSFFSSMLALDPAERPATWREVLSMLDNMAMAASTPVADIDAIEDATFVNTDVIREAQQANATAFSAFRQASSSPIQPLARVPSRARPKAPLPPARSPAPRSSAPTQPALAPSRAAGSTGKVIACDCGKQFDVSMFYGGFRLRCDRCLSELVVPSDPTVAPARILPVNRALPPPPLAAPLLPAASPAPRSASAGAVTVAWAAQGGPHPEDLSSERVLRGCRTVEFEGVQRPSIGGYVLLSKIGRGGMGVVYFAANPRTGKGYAIKILPWSSQPGHEDLVARFFREARLASQLDSVHLVDVIDVDEDATSGHHYLVMEFIRGVSAGAWMRDVHRQAGLLTPESTSLDIMIAATKGLASAHLAGVVHRDVKPDNILIPTKEGALQFQSAKLADLGLARADTGEQSLTGAQFMLGTPGYMAPEQIRDSTTAKKPADVFSVGATLYALLAGKAPFLGTNAMHTVERTLKEAPRPMKEVRTGVSAPTARLLDICLSQNRSERFPDAFAVLEALEKCRSALGRDDAAVTRAVARVSELVHAEERGEKVRTGL